MMRKLLSALAALALVPNWAFAQTTAGRPIPPRSVTGTATTDTATAKDLGGWVIWKSTASSAKTQTLVACNTQANGLGIGISDGQGTAQANNISIAPPGGSTINGSATPVVINTNRGTAQFLCDGGSTNWILVANASGSGGGVTSVTSTCPAAGPLTGAVTLNTGAIPTPETASFSPAAADCGGWFEFNCATACTLTLPGATVSAGYYLGLVSVAMTSTAGLTVQAPGTTLIDGANTLYLPPGSSTSFSYNGTSTGTGTSYYRSRGSGDQVLQFTTLGVCSGASCYLPNSRLVWADVGCLGGGGGGGGGGANATGALIYGGGGGGAGASKTARWSRAELLAVATGTPARVPYQISTGGAAGTGGTSSGNTLAPGTSGAVPTISTQFGGTKMACNGGGGGGGGGGTGGAGGGGAGLGGSGANATANTNTGGVAGNLGGATGLNNSQGAGTAAWPCAGPGGNSMSSATGNGGAGSRGLCAVSGASGGGVTAAAVATGGGNGTAPDGFATGATGGSGGPNTGANGADGANTTLGDSIPILTPNGVIGGGSGGGGGGSITGNGGNGGFSGYGAGGSGGGGCGYTTGAGPCTAGNGATGGQGIVVVWEHNQ
jgi:hypothetical protein